MRTLWIVAGMMVVGLATASGAVGPGSAEASCGHVEELVAARRALDAGDSEAAVRHLRTADALLARCMRDGPPREPRGEDEQADTQAG